MKIIFVLSLLVGFAAQASLKFTLDCTPDEALKHAPGYSFKVQKGPHKVEGKWVNSYILVQNQEGQDSKQFQFVPAGNGDEDYNEYNLVDPNNLSPIRGASIQNYFKWAGLIDAKGYSAYDCR